MDWSGPLCSSPLVDRLEWISVFQSPSGRLEWTSVFQSPGGHLEWTSVFQSLPSLQHHATMSAPFILIWAAHMLFYKTQGT